MSVDGHVSCSVCGAIGAMAPSCPLANPRDMGPAQRAAEEWRTDMTGASQARIAREHDLEPQSVSQAFRHAMGHRAAWLRMRTARIVAGFR